MWRDTDDRSGSAGTLTDPIAQIGVDTRPTLLIAGEDRAAAALAMRAERAGLRCVGQIAPEALAGRLTQMVSLDLILLDTRGLDMAQRLGWPGARALAGRRGPVGARLAVITDLAGLDCTLALFDGPETDFLCEPAESEIITLLVMAGLRRPSAANPSLPLQDSSRDSALTRLEQLSDEVRRLAMTIEQMALGEPAIPLQGGVLDKRGSYRGEQQMAERDPAERFQPRARQQSAGPVDKDRPSSIEIRQFIRARRMRDQFLPADLFADPAWDMILDLLAARLAGQHVSVSSLCIAAAVPPTTALRWIRQLTDRAVFARIADPADGRRVFIELTDNAAEAALAWVQAVQRNGGLLSPLR